LAIRTNNHLTEEHAHDRLDSFVVGTHFRIGGWTCHVGQRGRRLESRRCRAGLRTERERRQDLQAVGLQRQASRGRRLVSAGIHRRFAQDGAKLKAFNVAYFTASTDDAEKNKEFAKSVGADYPILSDPTGATAIAYGIYNAERNAAQRVTFIIDKEGKIAAIDKAVKTETHAADVAARLAELGVEKK
jgi:hypothetical protein